MFIVSVLLLEDALKPATPLANGAISETPRQFAHSHGHKILYKRIKLSKNTNQMFMTSVMM